MTDETPPDRVLRFRRSEILMHWAIAVPFLVCWATALVLVLVYNRDPLGPYRSFFSSIHRLSGACLLVLPALVVVSDARHWRVHLHNVSRAWRWSRDDLRWLIRIGLASVSGKVSLPEEGKFNAGEKLNFMMVMTATPLLLLTGFLMWLPGVAFLPWLAHFALAVLVTPMMLVHLFMATIHPGTRAGLSGMVSGFVDRAWAKRHYRAWYRERFEAEPTPARALEPRREGTTPAGALEARDAVVAPADGEGPGPGPGDAEPAGTAPSAPEAP